MVSGGLYFSDWAHQCVSTYCFRMTEANYKKHSKQIKYYCCSSVTLCLKYLVIKPYLAYSKCSVWVDSELCKVNSKLYKTDAKMTSFTITSTSKQFANEYRCSSQAQPTINLPNKLRSQTHQKPGQMSTIKKKTFLMYTSFTATLHFHIFHHPWI